MDALRTHTQSPRIRPAVSLNQGNAGRPAVARSGSEETLFAKNRQRDIAASEVMDGREERDNSARRYHGPRM